MPNMILLSHFLQLFLPAFYSQIQTNQEMLARASGARALTKQKNDRKVQKTYQNKPPYRSSGTWAFCCVYVYVPAEVREELWRTCPSWLTTPHECADARSRCIYTAEEAALPKLFFSFLIVGEASALFVQPADTTKGARTEESAFYARFPPKYYDL